MHSTRWTSVALGLAGALSAYAQTSNVTTCLPSWQWSINNKTQTPCLVAAFLESACGTPTSVDAIPINTHYLGPTGPKQNQCICSSVVYSLVSACGGCQGRTYQNWTTWSMNCDNSTVPMTSFPLPIPAAVSVPDWAFINVSDTGDQLDPIVAQGVIAGVPAPTTTSPATSTTAAPLSTQPVSSTAAATTSPTTSTSAAADSGSSSGSNTGAIAGGVVGGLIVLAIIVLGAIWWFVWRRRNAVQSDLVFNKGALMSSNPPITQHTTGSSAIPLTSIYDNPTGTSGSNYPMSAYGTSGVYTSAPTASRRSEESISYSLAHFAGAGQQGPLQPVRQQPGFYRGTPELS